MDFVVTSQSNDQSWNKPEWEKSVSNLKSALQSLIVYKIGNFGET